MNARLLQLDFFLHRNLRLHLHQPQVERVGRRQDGGGGARRAERGLVRAREVAEV